MATYQATGDAKYLTAIKSWAQAANWGLGVSVDLSGGAGRRAFGHGGMASSRGFVDPDCGLVAVVVCNGLPNPIAAEQRLMETTDAVYSVLGDIAARFRRA